MKIRDEKKAHFGWKRAHIFKFGKVTFQGHGLCIPHPQKHYLFKRFLSAAKARGAKSLTLGSLDAGDCSTLEPELLSWSEPTRKWLNAQVSSRQKTPTLVLRNNRWLVLYLKDQLWCLSPSLAQTFRRYIFDLSPSFVILRLWSDVNPPLGATLVLQEACRSCWRLTEFQGRSDTESPWLRSSLRMFTQSLRWCARFILNSSPVVLTPKSNQGLRQTPDQTWTLSGAEAYVFLTSKNHI